MPCPPLRRLCLPVIVAAAVAGLCTACGSDSGDAGTSSAAMSSSTVSSPTPAVASESGPTASVVGFCKAAGAVADDLVNGLAVANIDNYRTIEPLAPPAIKPSLDYLVKALTDAQGGAKPDTTKIDAEGKKVGDYYTANCK